MNIEWIKEVIDEIELNPQNYSGYNYWHPQKKGDITVRLLEKMGASLVLNESVLMSVIFEGNEYKSSEYIYLISSKTGINKTKLANFIFKSCYMNAGQTVRELKKLINE